MQLAIRYFKPEDIPFGMRLKDEAGWNHTEADWRRALALQPDGCFLAEQGGEPVGTITSCVYGSVAWIAMMLVAESAQRRDTGLKLMCHMINYLERAGASSIRLYATSRNQPLYESIGFVPEAAFQRYQGCPIAFGPNVELRQIKASDYNDLYALNHHATGNDRRRLLGCFLAENPDGAWVCHKDGSLTGFILVRPGSFAVGIGPCIADSTTGPTLLRYALSRHAGQTVIVDVPKSHLPACSLVETAGLVGAHSFRRMRWGEVVAGHREWIWAGSGFELH